MDFFFSIHTQMDVLLVMARENNTDGLFFFFNYNALPGSRKLYEYNKTMLCDASKPI